MIRLRLRASNAFWSWGLARLMRTPYGFSHVDIVRPEGDLLGAHILPGVDTEGNPVKSGVAIRPPNYGNPVRTMDVCYRCSQRKADKFVDIAEGEIGKPFDWTALTYFLSPYRIRRDWLKTEGYFCSELVAWCMMEAKIKGLNLDFDTESITPRDFLLPEVGGWTKIVTYPAHVGFWCR